MIRKEVIGLVKYERLHFCNGALRQLWRIEVEDGYSFNCPEEYMTDLIAAVEKLQNAKQGDMIVMFEDDPNIWVEYGKDFTLDNIKRQVRFDWAI